MFKTIEQCKLELVAHSVGMAPVRSLNYYAGRPDTDPLDQGIIFPSEQRLDYFPASAARVSFGNEDKTGKDPEKDRKLMKYLADHEHMTPFEHQSATFLIEVPLFIRSQIMRHRTFAYNEISRRYTDENLEFWVPTTVRGQSDSNRQASSDKVIEKIRVPVGFDDDLMWEDFLAVDLFKNSVKGSMVIYNMLVDNGVAREQARATLPQSLLTKFYMTGNLRNWAHFVRLRKDAHAQKEVQVVANRIDEELTKLWPTAWGVLNA